jgi:hypothetical protein
LFPRPRAETDRTPPHAMRSPRASELLLALLVVEQQQQLLLGADAAAAAAACSFCALGGDGKAHTFDLSTLPTKTYALSGAWPNGTSKGSEGYEVTSPCRGVDSPTCGLSRSPMTQGCKPLGTLEAGTGPNSTLVELTASGFNITIRGGFDYPVMHNGRNAVFEFVCDNSAPPSAGPDPGVVESPAGFYRVHWKTAAACAAAPPAAAAAAVASCPPPPPAPPPVPPPAPCMPGADVCLPSWKPTWHMRNSTVLYTCNNSGAPRPGLNASFVAMPFYTNAPRIFAKIGSGQP